MTEDEAKTKWCPMARTIITENSEWGDPIGHVVANRAVKEGTFPKNAKCFGSHCMMWRWTEMESRTGHCGLAGAPL